MTVPTRAPRRLIFNAAEIALLALIVASWIRLFTVPSAASIAKVTRSANQISCAPDGTLDMKLAVKTALDGGQCAFIAAEAPAVTAYWLIAVIAVVAALVVFGTLAALGKTRDALFRPWLRLGLLGLLAVSAYPAIMITAAASDVAAEQSALAHRLQASCVDAGNALEGLEAGVEKRCRQLAYASRTDCLNSNDNRTLYDKARDKKLVDALAKNNLVVAPKCALPPQSAAEQMRETLGITGTAPQTSSPDEDPNTVPVDAGMDAPDGGEIRDDVSGQVIGGPGDPPPHTCSLANCLEPARCVDNVCTPPAPMDKPAQHKAGLSVADALIIGALGLPAVVAALIIAGSGETEESVESGERLYDAAEAFKRDPAHPEGSRMVARGARRTGRYREGLEHLVRPEDRRRLEAEIKCLREIKASAAPGANGLVAGCAVEKVDMLGKFFTTTASCNGLTNNDFATLELLQWVAKCICAAQLGASVSREIQCDLP